jgi:hypothetical protein
MIYTHVLNRGGRGVLSPLDAGSFDPSLLLSDNPAPRPAFHPSRPPASGPSTPVPSVTSTPSSPMPPPIPPHLRRMP